MPYCTFHTRINNRQEIIALLLNTIGLLYIVHAVNTCSQSHRQK